LKDGSELAEVTTGGLYCMTLNHIISAVETQCRILIRVTVWWWFCC